MALSDVAHTEEDVVLLKQAQIVMTGRLAALVGMMQLRRTVLPNGQF